MNKNIKKLFLKFAAWIAFYGLMLSSVSSYGMSCESFLEHKVPASVIEFEIEDLEEESPREAIVTRVFNKIKNRVSKKQIRDVLEVIFQRYTSYDFDDDVLLSKIYLGSGSALGLGGALVEVSLQVLGYNSGGVAFATGAISGGVVFVGGHSYIAVKMVSGLGYRIFIYDSKAEFEEYINSRIESAERRRKRNRLLNNVGEVEVKPSGDRGEEPSSSEDRRGFGTSRATPII